MDGIKILLYHSVGPIHPDDDLGIRVDEKRFRSQMEFLEKNGYNVWGLSDAVRCIRDEKPIPDKTIVITFDDGYKDNIDTALPILEKQDFKATFFVTVNFIGTVKTSPERDWQSWECMGEDDLRELVRRGHGVESHGMNHVDLTGLDEQKRRQELMRSKDAIGHLTGRKARFFSYPYGFFDAALAELAREAGYEGACTTQSGGNTHGACLYKLKRMEIVALDTEETFRKKLESC